MLEILAVNLVYLLCLGLIIHSIHRKWRKLGNSTPVNWSIIDVVISVCVLSPAIFAFLHTFIEPHYYQFQVANLEVSIALQFITLWILSGQITGIIIGYLIRDIRFPGERTKALRSFQFILVGSFLGILLAVVYWWFAIVYLELF